MRATEKLNMKVWLVDFTHTGQGFASDAVPAAIGMLAEFVEANCNSFVQIELFKFPEDLTARFEEECPNIIGFSNYVWNYRLSYKFIEEIKTQYPEIITIWGGPNAPSDHGELQDFLETHPAVDFYIIKEAELALSMLVNELQACGFAAPKVNCSALPNIVFRDQHKAVVSNDLQRVMDLSTIPSPYLSGRLDRFLDGRLMPIIQTNRGCPFSCSFCTEGQTYWNKVRKKPNDIIAGELNYISNFFERHATNARSDLLIADSNFGMFPEDLETCQVISKSQERNGYPQYINVATGKNKKERVLEAARLVNGAMKLAGSVQSLDAEVQQNMKRSNISADQIVDMALEAKEIGANTYSEVILCLPGDTKKAHTNTLRALVNADFSTISMYQLMILPGTEFGSEATIKSYEMELKYRAIPRAFGKYNVLGKEKNIVEVEAICIANNTMPYEEYLECRKLNLFVNIFYNDRIFDETLSILRLLDIDIFAFLETLASDRTNSRVNALIDQFIEETRHELYDEVDEVLSMFEDEATYAEYVDGVRGANLIFKFKTLSMTKYFNDICELISKNVEELASRAGLSADLKQILRESVEYRRLQIEDIFDRSREPKIGHFNFDFKKLSADGLKDVEDLRSSPLNIEFVFTGEQEKDLDKYFDLFGNDMVGISRILSRARITNFFRTPHGVQSCVNEL